MILINKIGGIRMKKMLISLAFCMSAVWAVDWTNSAIAALNVSQNSNHNWSAGGEDAMVWQASLKASSEAAFVSWVWKNNVELAYGRTRLGDESSRKHLDKLFLETMLNYNLFQTVKPYVSGRLESQFTTSYAYSDTADRQAISAFWDPGYLTASVGMSYIPDDRISTRMGFAVKQTFAEEYGWADDPDTQSKVETFKNEPGLESITEVNIPWNKILSYKSRLSAFVNFEGVEAIDGRWENSLDAQVAKYLTFSAGLEMLYDVDLDKDSQLRQNITIGLTYQLL